MRPPPRFCALRRRKRLNEMFRVSLAKNIRSAFGLCGGMAFQACSQVSLTHSSASSRLSRMLREIVIQYAPYFCRDCSMAS